MKNLVKNKLVLFLGLCLIGILAISLYSASGDVIAYNVGGTDIYRLQTNGDIWPGTTATSDIGSSSLEYQDAYVTGTGYIDTVSVESHVTFESLLSTQTATPPAVGTLMVDSNYVVWVGTSTAAGGWTKVGGQ